MNSGWEADGLMKLRSDNLDRYKRNFLRQAVCELRFPTLMELGEPRPPASFVGALRKEYPHLELANELTLGIGTSIPGSNNSHIFRSSKYTWAVSLKASSVTIETTSYADYENLKSRVLKVVEAAGKIIDSDFFTRIGLRYINVIDVGEDPTLGWVNPILVAPIQAGCFSGIHEYAGKMQIAASDGGCLLQHGIRLKQSREADPPPEYFIDIDSFRNEIPLAEVESALDAIHSQAFDVFDWCIGEKSKDYLSRIK